MKIFKFTKNTPIIHSSILDGFRITLESKSFKHQREKLINFLCDTFGEGYVVIDTKSMTCIQNKRVWELYIQECKYWNEIIIVLNDDDKLKIFCNEFNIDLEKIKIKELEDDKSLVKIFKNIENEFVRLIKYTIKKNIHNHYNSIIEFVKDKFNVSTNDVKLINYRNSIALQVKYYNKNYLFEV